jgi:multidrug efflux pump subunit AcrA (membrane-fusion protein)
MWLKNKRWMFVLLMLIVAVQLTACGETESPPKVEPALVEEVEGSEFNRVILTERAAERLGIETTAIRAGELSQTQTVEGQVVAQDSQATAPGEGLVRVALDKSTLSKVDSGQPARILLQADDDDDDGFLAELFELPDADEDDDDDDDEDEDETLHFMLESAWQDLTEGQSVFVKLTLAEGEPQGLIIPYSAVIYGLNGETWTYINPEPLTFMRQPITVDRIEGGLAYLSDAPPVGTPVVTVGAQLLYGADTGVGK